MLLYNIFNLYKLKYFIKIYEDEKIKYENIKIQ